MEALRPAPVTGSSVAMARAEQELDRALTERVAEDLRQRIFTLAEALFQSVGMQLSVEKYKAIAVDRGASLDTLDYPLNNRIWLKEQFAKIREIKSEPARLAALDEIVNWTNPGPGGFYDDLGNPARQPHLVRGAGFGEDPSAFALPRSDFEEDLVLDDDDPKPMGSRRVSWMDHAEILYDGVLRMHYDGLDPKARYKLRVVYAGDNPERLMRLTAGENIEIHPLIKRAFPYKPQEFDIPPDATARGQLELAWRGQPGLAGNGRNCQVAEVWLIKKSPAEK